MALIGNYSVLNKSPGRFRSGSTVSDNRANYNNPGANRGMYSGLFYSKSSFPGGYRPPGSWIIAQKTGAMSSFTIIGGSGATGTAALAGGVNIAATVSGVGTIDSATGALIVSAVAALTGAGTLAASVVGVLEAAATLAGVGDLTGAIDALGALAVSLAGVGSLTASQSALGDMAADLSPFTDLSSETFVAALLAEPVDGTYTLKQVLQIIAAASAGKNSGGENSSAYRNLADDRDVIVGTTTSTGNRTAVTYDPEG